MKMQLQTCNGKTACWGQRVLLLFFFFFFFPCSTLNSFACNSSVPSLFHLLFIKLCFGSILLRDDCFRQLA